MCWEYDQEYMQARIDEARKAMQKAAEDAKKPKPAAPGAADEPQPKRDDLVPA